MSDYRLKVFVSVAEHLSFTKASQELFISQPAISKHIHELESEFDTRLFTRKGNTVTLTDSGQLLLKHCRIILAQYAEMNFQMHELNHQLEGKLHLGASTTIAQYLLPNILAQYKHRYPNIELSLITGNTNDIEIALQQQQIDLGLVEGNNKTISIKYTPLVADELVAVVSTHGAYAPLDEISLEQIKMMPLVLRENGSGTLDIIKTALASHGLSLSDLNICIQLGSTESIKRYVESTNSIAILSIRSVDRELMENRLKVVEIPSLDLTRQFSFIQRFGMEPSVAQCFIDYALSCQL